MEYHICIQSFFLSYEYVVIWLNCTLTKFTVYWTTLKMIWILRWCPKVKLAAKHSHIPMQFANVVQLPFIKKCIDFTKIPKQCYKRVFVMTSFSSRKKSLKIQPRKMHKWCCHTQENCNRLLCWQICLFFERWWK